MSTTPTNRVRDTCSQPYGTSSMTRVYLTCEVTLCKEKLVFKESGEEKREGVMVGGREGGRKLMALCVRT